MTSGQDNNITETADLLTFASAGVKLPFVQRASTSNTPFYFQSSLITDNPIAFAAASASTGVPPLLTPVNPPTGSPNALFEEKDGSFSFTAKLLGAGLELKEFEKVDEEDSPWSVASMLAISNFPGFGQYTDKCFNVSFLSDWMTAMDGRTEESDNYDASL